jgi:hypothetical protein
VLVRPSRSDGEWVYERSSGGIIAKFMTTDNTLNGFVLTGEHVKQRGALMSVIKD